MKNKEEAFTIPTDALAEIQVLAPNLSDNEAKYVYWRTMAVAPLAAYQRSGYSGGGWRTVETRPRIREAMIELQEQLDPKYRITREKVVGLLMEGIEMARRKEQPKTLIEGALALAGVAGVGAAQKVQIDQRTLYEQRQISGSAPKALPHLNRSNLEALVGVRRTLPTTIIDAEVIEIQKEGT